MNQFNILCIGNSLTAGFPFYSPMNSLGDPRSSYPFHLRELLQQSSLKHANQISTINAGIPGDSTDGIGRRLPRLLSSYQPAITILLGGTNDIAMGYRPNSIIRVLERLWDSIKTQKSHPISCTLPPTIFQDLNMNITSLNKLIIKNSSAKGILNVDLYTPLLLNDILDPDFDSGDGAHLNRTGYQEMGKIIFKNLFPEIERLIGND
ncbi:MAG: SGNH/GDSL hydrolase family protein [Candidatus Hodarchaeota archaeon]